VKRVRIVTIPAKLPNIKNETKEEIKEQNNNIELG